MEQVNKELTLHPQVLDRLFSYKKRAKLVFDDVLGVHEIDHIALTYIDSKSHITSLSSTPALEFNLFSSGLWRFDKTYQNDWISLCHANSWQQLYEAERYDELYYCKQIKHRYPTGLSIAAQHHDSFIICSVASKKDCQHTQDIFATEHKNFGDISRYCTNQLAELLINLD